MLYRFSDCVLDSSRHALTRGGRTVELQPRTLRLLLELIENRDRVVSRQELHARIWAGRIVSDNALNVLVRAARRAVGDGGRRQAIIRTLPGAGYRFVADVEVSASLFPDRSVSRSTPLGADTTMPEPVDPLDRRLLTRPSVIVLPLEVIGDADRAAIIAVGLTHDITTRLARSKSLFVIARGTAFRFAGQPQDIGEIGHTLGVRYAVQGAVQTRGNRLKVTVALGHTSTRREIWTEQYHRKLDDFMAVQEDIADLIVGVLQSELEREEQQRSLLMPSSNLDAWTAYHRGCWHMYRFRQQEWGEAMRYFRQSIQQEPHVPRPYAGMSFIYFQRVFLGFTRDRAGDLQQCVDYASRSIQIDPYDPMGHWALSRAHLLQSDLAASKDSLGTAIGLNPSYAIAQYSLGWVGMHLGENQMCLEKIGMARRLSPYDPLKFAMLGVTALNLALIGRAEEAKRLAADSVQQPNAHLQVDIFAAMSMALSGDLDGARPYFRRALAAAPGYTAENFFAVFPFQRDEDVRRIRGAFADLQRPALAAKR